MQAAGCLIKSLIKRAVFKIVVWGLISEFIHSVKNQLAPI